MRSALPASLVLEEHRSHPSPGSFFTEAVKSCFTVAPALSTITKCFLLRVKYQGRLSWSSLQVVLPVVGGVNRDVGPSSRYFRASSLLSMAKRHVHLHFEFKQA